MWIKKYKRVSKLGWLSNLTFIILLPSMNDGPRSPMRTITAIISVQIEKLIWVIQLSSIYLIYSRQHQNSRTGWPNFFAGKYLKRVKTPFMWYEGVVILVQVAKMWTQRIYTAEQASIPAILVWFVLDIGKKKRRAK